MTVVDDAESVDPTADAPTPVEVVEPPAPAGRAYTALERAADVALQLPASPGRDEFLSLAMQARILSMSGGAPAPIRNNPHLAFHLVMIGRDLGISGTAALQLVDVIGWDKRKPTDYDNVQLSLSPELVLGQIRRLGLGSIRPGERTDERAVAIACGPSGEVWGETEFTWQDAITAGLVGKDCQPGNHATSSQTRTRNDGSSYTTTKCPCHQGYITYPKRMLWWRAAGWCQSDFFPEASIGLYSPEELGAVVDEQGRPIDPATIELPEGYVRELPPPNPLDELLPQEEADAFAGRGKAIAAAGTDARAALNELWSKEDDPLPVPSHLTARQKGKANARMTSIEAKIKRGEFGEDAKTAWAASTWPGKDGAQEPAGASETDGGADTADEAPEAAVGDPGPSGEATPAPDPAVVPPEVYAEVADLTAEDVTIRLFDPTSGLWTDAEGDPPTGIADQRRELARLLHAERSRLDAVKDGIEDQVQAARARCRTEAE